MRLLPDHVEVEATTEAEFPAVVGPEDDRDVFVRLGADLHGPMPLIHASERLGAGVYSRFHEASFDRASWRPLTDVVRGVALSPGTLELADGDPEVESGRSDHIDFGELDSPGGGEWMRDALAKSSGGVAPEEAWCAVQRWSLWSWGGLVLVLTLLPVAAAAGQTRHWWSWPAGVPGVGIAWSLGLWGLLAVAAIVVGVISIARPAALHLPPRIVLVCVWGTGWPAMLAGSATGVTAACWLVLAPVVGWLGAVPGGVARANDAAPAWWRSPSTAGVVGGVLVALIGWGAFRWSPMLTWRTPAAWSTVTALICIYAVLRALHTLSVRTSVIGIVVIVSAALAASWVTGLDAATQHTAWVGGNHGHHLVRAALVAGVGTASAALLSVTLLDPDGVRGGVRQRRPERTPPRSEAPA